MADESYIGKGKIYIAPKAGGKMRPIGNCSKLDFAVTEEKKELKDYTSPGGGNANSLTRISAVNAAMTLHDISAENLAMAVFGDASAVTAGSVVDEAVTAYLGGLSRVANMIDTSVAPVVTDNTGVTTYVEGTDYEVSPAGIFVLTGGSIVDASTIKVDYTKKAANVVEALTQSAQEWKLVFDGLNEAQSGTPVLIDIHRFKFGPLKGLGVIGDDFAGLELDGESLSDASITAAGKSKYFKVTKA